MTLDTVRQAIDSCGDTDTAVFARRTRNAIAMAIVARESSTPPPHEPPVAQLREVLGDDLADHLATVYAGGEDWTTHAIDALEPLNALARS